jgi:hypothetical protein
VVINKTVDEDRRRRIVVADLGNAEALFENRDHFRAQAKRLVANIHAEPVSRHLEFGRLASDDVAPKRR